MRARTLVVALGVWAAVLPAIARAETITVSTESDVVANDGQCSLREAISAANNDAVSGAAAGECKAGSGTDAVAVPEGVFAIERDGIGEIANSTGDFNIRSDLEIAGAGAGATTITARGRDRVFQVENGRTVTLRGLTITGGHAVDATDMGSFVGAPGANVTGSAGGAGVNGGGIHNAGTLTIVDCRIVDNQAGSGGDGADTSGGDSTGSGASPGSGTGGAGGAGGAGGGIFSSGPLTITDTVISGNVSGAGGEGGNASGGTGSVSATGGSGAAAAGGAGGDGGDGGGIHSSDTLVLTRVQFVANGTGSGGRSGVAVGSSGVFGTTNNGGNGGAGGSGPAGDGGNGAGVFAGGATTIVDSTFSSNATGGGGNGRQNFGGGGGGGGNANGNGGNGAAALGAAGGNGGLGGAIRATGTLTVTGSTLDHNRTGSGGSGGQAQGGTGGSGGLTNGSGGPGGAALGGSGGDPGVGAGIYGGQVSLTNSTLVLNSTGTPGNGANGLGGGGGTRSGSGTGGNGGAGGGGAGGDAGAAAAMLATTTPTTLTHVTIAGNKVAAPGTGGTGTGGNAFSGGTPGTGTPGLAGSTTATTLISAASMTLTNSIVSGTPTMCAGTMTDGGHNLVFGDASCPGTSADPLLGSLADLGGPTKTVPLGAGSPARDAAGACTGTDQRGLARPQGAACDSGAYEAAPPAVVTGDASAVGEQTATLNGTVNPNLRAATAHFEYGPTTAYGTATADTAVAAGGSATAVSAALTGLAAATTLHYRLVAVTGDGTSVGADKTLTTAPNTLPVLSAVGVTNTTFKVTRVQTAITAAKQRPKPKLGTTFKYTLSEAASVQITIQRRAAGKRKGKRCVKPTAKLKQAKRCTRFVTVGALTRLSKLGRNTVAFSGRIGAKPLAKGRYRAVLVATDAGLAKSESRSLAFRVV